LRQVNRLFLKADFSTATATAAAAFVLLALAGKLVIAVQLRIELLLFISGI